MESLSRGFVLSLVDQAAGDWAFPSGPQSPLSRRSVVVDIRCRMVLYISSFTTTFPDVDPQARLLILGHFCSGFTGSHTFSYPTNAT